MPPTVDPARGSSLQAPIALVAAAFAAVYVVWGSTYLAIRFAIETVPPWTMAGMRFVAAGAILYAVMRTRAPKPTAAQWRTTIVAGLLMLFVANGLVCWSEQYVNSGLAALMIATVSLWMVLLDWLLFKGPRPTPRIALGLVIGMIGVYLLLGRTGLVGEPLHVGGAIGLLTACASWALGSLYTRGNPVPKSPFLSTSMQMLAGGTALLVMGAVMGEWGPLAADSTVVAHGVMDGAVATEHPGRAATRLDFAAISWTSAAAMAYLIVFGSIVALSSYVWLLQVSTPAKVATYSYVNPVVAIALGYLLAGEPVTQQTGVAATIIILAVGLITTARAKPKPKPAPATPPPGDLEPATVPCSAK